MATLPYQVGFKMCFPPDPVVRSVDVMRPSIDYKTLLRAENASALNVSYVHERAYGKNDNPPLCLHPRHVVIQDVPHADNATHFRFMYTETNIGAKPQTRHPKR